MSSNPKKNPSDDGLSANAVESAGELKSSSP